MIKTIVMIAFGFVVISIALDETIPVSRYLIYAGSATIAAMIAWSLAEIADALRDIALRHRARFEKGADGDV